MLIASKTSEELNNQPVKYEKMDNASKWHNKKKQDSPNVAATINRIQLLAQQTKKYGVFTPSHLLAAGFKYTGNGDTARCNDCGLEVSNWTSDMNPFTIHSQRQPTCSFVCSIAASISFNKSSISSLPRTKCGNSTTINDNNNPSKRQKAELLDSESFSNILIETNLLQQVRRRSFSHRSQKTIPSSSQMIEAGFFNCNVGDRVICIYCNLICQQWASDTDDPCEVHKTLSPNCPYVKAKLVCPISLSTTNDTSSLRLNDIECTASCNPTYSDIPKRRASYATWSNEASPSIDSLVRAGFFYTGTNTIVTCFYCDGSLQNWGPNDNPMIEHARWFPHCAYARQLCGEALHRKIQESKRAQQERARINEMKERVGTSDVTNTNIVTNSRQVLIPDESTLSRLVAARLDSSISQRLLDKNFKPSSNSFSGKITKNIGKLLIPDESTLSKLVAARMDLPISRCLLAQNLKLSIIKQCWEDQLRIKKNDFVSDCDLYMACVILKKQIEDIGGKRENIIIPSVKMKQLQEQREGRLREEFLRIDQLNQFHTKEPLRLRTNIDSLKRKRCDINHQSQCGQPPSPSDPCMLYLAKEKQLRCIPCGHMATCVPCGNSLKWCPICRQEIERSVRNQIWQQISGTVRP